MKFKSIWIESEGKAIQYKYKRSEFWISSQEATWYYDRRWLFNKGIIAWQILPYSPHWIL